MMMTSDQKKHMRMSWNIYSRNCDPRTLVVYAQTIDLMFLNIVLKYVKKRKKQ